MSARSETIAESRWSFLRASPLEIVYLAAATAVLGGGLAVAIGPLEALRLGGVLAVLGIAPGAAIARRLLPGAGLLVLVVVGAVLGMAMWSLGGMVSHLTGNTLVRWLPTLLAAAVWFLPARWAPPRAPIEPLPPAVLGGALVGLVGLLPALKLALSTAPVSFSGWHSFYTDLTFHVGIASEVAARSPQVFPWAADSTLSYPWLFHAAMGVWSAGSGVPAADTVLIAWPLLYVVLVPALIAIVAFQITRSRVAATISPVAFVLAHGLAFLPTSLVQVPLFQISPTRDFANLVALLGVLAFVRLLRPEASGARHNAWWWLALAVTAFVATGAKASELPVLLGGLLLGLFAVVVTGQFRLRHLLVLVTFAVPAIGSYLLVLPDLGGSQGLALGPLTFLPPDTPNRTLVSAVIVAFLAVGILAIGVVLGRAREGGWVVSGVLTGVLLAGLIGLASFTHVGYSQLYFWQAAEPILAIALAWAVAVSVRGRVVRVVVAAGSVFLAANVLAALFPNPLIVSAGIAVSALVAAFFVTDRPSRPLGVVLAAALLTQAAVGVGIPRGVEGGFASTVDDSSAIHESQLGAFAYIRDNSDADALVVTNRHCRTGTETGECDPRWFALSAFGERRVLIEGWGYIAPGNSPEEFEDDIEQSDDFIQSPTAGEAQALADRGVRFVYVDKRFDYSSDLDSVAELVFDSEFAAVYALAATS